MFTRMTCRVRGPTALIFLPGPSPVPSLPQTRVFGPHEDLATFVSHQGHYISLFTLVDLTNSFTSTVKGVEGGCLIRKLNTVKWPFHLCCP